MGNILARKIAAAMDLDSADSEPKRVTVHNTAGLSLCFWVNGGGPFYASPKRGVANSASFALPRHIATTGSMKLQATVVVDGDGTSFRIATWDLPADRFRSNLSLTLDPMLEGLPMSTVKLLVSAQRGVRRRRARKEAERIAAEKERKRRAATAIERFARGHLARSTRTCPICYDDVPLPAFKPLNTGHPTCKRDHKACSGCVRQYVESALGDGQMYVRCMHAGCKELVAHSDLKKHATPAAWRKFEEERHAAHTRRLNDEGDAAFLALAGSQLRRCPGCHVLIYRHAGRDHMHCRCGRNFNWSQEEARVTTGSATAAPSAATDTMEARLAALRDAPGTQPTLVELREEAARRDAAFRDAASAAVRYAPPPAPPPAPTARPRNRAEEDEQMRRAIEASLATHQTEQAERDAIAESLAASAPPPPARSASAPARLEEKNDDDVDDAAVDGEEDEPVIAESPFARRVRLAEAAVEAREAVEAEEAAVAAAEAEAAVPPVEWTFVAPGPDAVARTPSQDPIAWAEAAAELAEDEGADDRRVAAAMALAARVGGGRWRPASVDVRVRTPRADAGAMLVDAAVASAPSRLSGCAVQ